MPGSKSGPPNRPEFVPAPAAFSRSAHERAFRLPEVSTVLRRILILCAFSLFLVLSQLSVLVTGVQCSRLRSE